MLQRSESRLERVHAEAHEEEARAPDEGALLRDVRQRSYEEFTWLAKTRLARNSLNWRSPAMLAGDVCLKYASKGIRRQGIVVLKHRIVFVRKQPMPCCPLPLLVQL